MIAQFWKNFTHRAHDRAGNAKCLLGCADDPSASAVNGVSDSTRDEALAAICKSFDIPQRQMYCLRAEDELMGLYRKMNGPRHFDQLQFERLWFELDDLLKREIPEAEFLALKTVGDVVRLVATRRPVGPIRFP